jgi:putative membrane protein
MTMWNYGPHWGMMGGYGYGYGPIGMILWVVILIAVIAGAVWLIRSLTARDRATQAPPHRSAGLSVLEERYARGDINRDEYLQKKQDLLA